MNWIRNTLRGVRTLLRRGTVSIEKSRLNWRRTRPQDRYLSLGPRLSYERDHLGTVLLREGELIEERRIAIAS